MINVLIQAVGFLKADVLSPVPFDEDDKDDTVWFLDHDYLENMYGMFKKVNGEFSDSPKLSGLWKREFPLITESCKIVESIISHTTVLSTGCVPHPGSFEPFRDVRGAGCGTLRATQLTEAVNYPEKLWVSNCDESLWSLLQPGPCNPPHRSGTHPPAAQPVPRALPVF